MRDRPPVCASWPERLTKTPCAVTLSMSLGDFIEVLEKNRRASPARRPGPVGLKRARSGNRDVRPRHGRLLVVIGPFPPGADRARPHRPAHDPAGWSRAAGGAD